jgi:4-hydroxybenzoate polyprenyltransferase
MGEVNLNNRFKSIIISPFDFMAHWRPIPAYEILSYVFMFASVPMLAYGIRPYNFEVFRIIIFTIITMFSGFFAAVIWNDINDVDIDSIVHPDRPIPSGRISKKDSFVIALFFSAITFIFSVLISFWSFFVVFVAAIFVALHNKYFKKLIKIPAYSEIFTPLQWTVVALLGYIVVWSTISLSNNIDINISFIGSISTKSYEVVNMLVLFFFTYFADSAHDLPEGIHDAMGDNAYGIRTYTTSFSSKTAAKISFIMLIVSGVLGVILFIRTDLTLIFLIPFIIMFVYTSKFSYLLQTNRYKDMKNFGLIVGKKIYNYLLFSFVLIFFDIFINIILLK